MKRGRKSSTKPEVASDGNKPKKVKSSDEGKSNDAQGYIASLPLHGEYLPSKGYSIVPAAVTETRQSLVEVFQMVRNQKRQGDKCSAADMEESRAKGALLFATLKKLNRLSHLYCKEARDKTLENKQELDGLHLQLQNLKYEMVHLSKEISNCLQFQSSHDDIQLISEEEFYDSAPAEISQPEVTKSNDHERMMARLHWELKQRQDLMSQRNTLQAEISSLESDISQQQSVIDNLKPSLDKLLEASLPIQENLNLLLDKKRREHSLSHLLPSPLYILYSQASAFSEAYDAANMKVSIQGDKEEAMSFVEQKPNDSRHQSDDDSDSDMDTKEDDSRRKNSKSSVSEMKTVVKPHPLFIQIDIDQSDKCNISLAIRYIPLVGVACVNISGLAGNGDDCCLLDADTILHELLLSGDDGEAFPSPLPHYLMKQLGEKVLMTELKLFGIPYQWVQLLCGLDFLSSSPQPVVEVTQKNIHKIIKAIKQRINMRSTLQNEVNKMMGSLVEGGGHVIDAGPDGQHLFPSSLHSKMTRFKKLTHDEALAHSEKFVDNEIFDVQNKANKFYLISFQLSEEQQSKTSVCRLHCLMCIRPTYPTVPPTFTLVLESQAQKKPHNHWIKAIEAEVNVHYSELLDGDGASRYQYLLARQLLKIQMCFDSLETTYPSYSRDAFLPHSTFSRKYCGRDRMPAYQFSSEKGLFSHRT